SQVAKGGLAFITIVLFVWAFIIVIKNKNRFLVLTGLYAMTMAGTMCLALQIKWDQPRMIMVYVPFILLIFFSGLYYAFQKKSSFLQLFLPIIAVLIFGSSFIKTIGKASDRLPVVQKNLKGDIYYGYTTDWQNYLQMSAYVADSLDENSYVACRKAPMSFVYGKGKSFYPVYTVFHSDPDSVLYTFKEAGVTHVMIASLRRNPKKVDGYIINTMHRLLNPVTQKYPQKLKLIKQIGVQEPAYLYEINY
ncbi:MAG TPA: hypothetical protein PKM16_06410, partial [Bacteroidia bacterium]|nr:hypothetical protein [Bacteroidia bacterium]